MKTKVGIALLGIMLLSLMWRFGLAPYTVNAASKGLRAFEIGNYDLAAELLAEAKGQDPEIKLYLAKALAALERYQELGILIESEDEDLAKRLIDWYLVEKGIEETVRLYEYLQNHPEFVKGLVYAIYEEGHIIPTLDIMLQNPEINWYKVIDRVSADFIAIGDWDKIESITSLYQTTPNSHVFLNYLELAIREGRLSEAKEFINTWPNGMTNPINTKLNQVIAETNEFEFLLDLIEKSYSNVNIETSVLLAMARTNAHKELNRAVLNNPSLLHDIDSIESALLILTTLDKYKPVSGNPPWLTKIGENNSLGLAVKALLSPSGHEYTFLGKVSDATGGRLGRLIRDELQNRYIEQASLHLVPDYKSTVTERSLNAQIVSAALSPSKFGLVLATRENSAIQLLYFSNPTEDYKEILLPDTFDTLDTPLLLWSEDGNYLAVIQYDQLLIYQTETWSLIIDRLFFADYLYGWKSDTELIYEVDPNYTILDVTTNVSRQVQYSSTPYLEPVNLLPGKLLATVNLNTLWWMVPYKDQDYTIVQISNHGQILRGLPIVVEKVNTPITVNNKYVVYIRDSNVVVIIELQ